MSLAPLERVMFDPVSWIHPEHFVPPAVLDSPRQRSALNGMLIAAYGLITERPNLARNALAAQFVEGWHLLPQVALLIACQRHRATLAWRGWGATLPEWLRQFSAPEIVGSFAPRQVPLTGPAQLLAWGKHELMAFEACLPESLSQRLSLLFSPMAGADEPYDSCRPLPSRLLLKLAFQHAKRNPTTPDAADFRWYIDKT